MAEGSEFRELLKYLDFFADIAKQLAEDPDRQNPVIAKYEAHYPVYTDEFYAFIDAVHASGIMMRDYIAQLNGRFPEQKWGIEDIKGADMCTLRAMLTKCVRSERFGDGRWAWYTKGGYFLAILQRVGELAEAA